MLTHIQLLRTLTLVAFLFSILLGRSLPVAQAACGCDKPPPEPAMVIPHVAYAGMTLTLFDNSFQDGQEWDVAFENEGAIANVPATVTLKRDLTDPTGTTWTPQLVVVVPEIDMGPTSIQATTANTTVNVPAEAFTVIGAPLHISEQNMEYEVQDYPTAVGSDGTLYVTVGAVGDVCKAISFDANFENYPLRMDGMFIINTQGFLIDSLPINGNDIFYTKPGVDQD